MSLWKIAWRSMQQRTLATTLTSVSIGLGVALVVTILVISNVIENKLNNSAQGYHLIVGARGGDYELVLNTVFHLGKPVENVPYEFYKEFTEGRFSGYTKLAIPCCMGDSYASGGETYRVVGTTPALFDELEYGRNRDGTPKRYAFQAGGRNFKTENFFEAVLGSVVAAKTGLKVGDTFQPAHGIIEKGSENERHREFTIVGILEPTGTPNDRAMFVNSEGFYLLEGHAKPVEETTSTTALLEGHDKPVEESASTAALLEGNDKPIEESASTAALLEEHDKPVEETASTAALLEGNAKPAEESASAAEPPKSEPAETSRPDPPHSGPIAPLPENQREVTAILVVCKSALGPQIIKQLVNEGTEARAVYPVEIATNIFQKFVGPLRMILLLLAILVVLVAGIGIMVSIYNSMNDRTREIAVMRALGAGRLTVMSIILLESIMLSLLGGLLGVVLGHGLIAAMNPYLVENTGLIIDSLQFDFLELIIVPGLVVLASVVGLLPALHAYRTDVARVLSAAP